MTFVEDLVERYRGAQERCVLAREAWEAAGKPLLREYPNGTAGAHPALKALVEAERHADRMMKALRYSDALAYQEGGGRPRGSQSAPDRVSRLKLMSAPKGAADRSDPTAAGQASCVRERTRGR